MPIVNINYLAVLVSAVVYFVIGAIWYGPLFGKAWVGLMKLKKDDIKMSDMAKPMIGSFLGYLLLCFVLAHFVDYAMANTYLEGAQTGFWGWLGFTVGTSAGTYLYGGKPMKLFALDNGYHLVGTVVAGVILAVWV